MVYRCPWLAIRLRKLFNEWLVLVRNCISFYDSWFWFFWMGLSSEPWDIFGSSIHANDIIFISSFSVNHPSLTTISPGTLNYKRNVWARTTSLVQPETCHGEDCTSFYDLWICFFLSSKPWNIFASSMRTLWTPTTSFFSAPLRSVTQNWTKSNKMYGRLSPQRTSGALTGMLGMSRALCETYYYPRIDTIYTVYRWLGTFLSDPAATGSITGKHSEKTFLSVLKWKQLLATLG